MKTMKNLMRVGVGAVFALCLMISAAFAGTTILTFDHPVTESVIPSGEVDPGDGKAVFSGVYEEGDFRVRPNGGIWYVAGDLGDPVGHLYSETLPGLSQYLVAQRISGGTILTGGEFLVKSVTVQSTANEAMTVVITGQNEDGNLLWQYLIPVPAGVSPVSLRLDTQVATRGSFLTPVNRVLIGALSAVGLRVLELGVEPKKSGGRKGR